MSPDSTTAPRRSADTRRSQMVCDHCGAPVPVGLFCTVCGSHQGTAHEAGHGRARLHRFAAQPSEHVATPNIFSTLFPHLGQHGVHQLRTAFGAALVLLLVVQAAGLVAGAIVGAAVLMPALYLVFLFEAEVYGTDPLRVLALTLGAGVVLGAVVTLLVDWMFGATAVFSAGDDLLVFLGLTVLVPVLIEVVKPLPVLVLQRRFGETIDGVVFGIAAGFGFGAAQTVVGYSAVLGVLPARVSPENWIYPLVTLAVTRPLLQGACTGAIAGALWAVRRRRVSTLEICGILVALLAHIGFSLVSQVLQSDGVQPLLVVGWQLLVDGLVIVYLRFLIHAALLEEAAEIGMHETLCLNCHLHVTAAGFCPHCGVALAAAPRRSATPRAVAPVAPVAP